MSQYPSEISGRKTELKRALVALKAGKHVVVHGPYGIGKTTFGRAVIARMSGPALFISLNQTPSEMAESMNRVLAAYPPKVRPERSATRSVYFRDRRTRIQAFRTLKRLMERLCAYRFPILVDDFHKISTSKLAFLNMLASMGFRLVLALDSGYNQANWESLKKACPSYVWIDLPKLSPEESKELILSQLSSQGIVPDPERVRFWVRAYQGHPLLLVERIRSAVDPGEGPL